MTNRRIGAVLCFLVLSFVASVGCGEEAFSSDAAKYTLRYKFQPGDTLRWNVVHRCRIRTSISAIDVEGSDVDRRGIFLPPASLHWSLYGVPEQIEDAATQECYWELQKFLMLALKANPNVLECLYTPMVEHADAVAQELLDNKSRFLSKLVYQTYNGYVLSQFRKLEQDLRTSGDLKWKHVMHLIRLLLSGITILRDEIVPVRIDPTSLSVPSGNLRDRLLAIRNGEMTWADVDAWRLELHKEFDQARDKTTLPDRPDYEWVNEYLIRARKQKV